MGWPGPMTQRQYLCWFIYVDQQDPDPYRCEIGEHVDQETWDRWEAKIRGTKWRVLADPNKKEGVQFS